MSKTFKKDEDINDRKEEIFFAIKDLPIIDFHCHLSPEDIYNDKPFRDLAHLWLKDDHYKMRLMRAFGVEHKYTQNINILESNETTYRAFCLSKVKYFLASLENAYGNPIREWSKLEFSKYFNIDLPLDENRAEEIYDLVNTIIVNKKLSPRKIIEDSRVEYIATTDDLLDSLEYHKKLASQDFKTNVVPTFRVDKAIDIRSDGFIQYLEKLGKLTQVERSFEGYLKALEMRMRDFKEAGCDFSDIGIDYFPSGVADYSNAKSAFYKKFSNAKLSSKEVDDFISFMYTCWLGKCAEYNFIAQIHIGVERNVNQKMYALEGADQGYDIVSDSISIKNIKNIFNETQKSWKLPTVIFYALNPCFYYPLVTLAGAFQGVSVGVPWWFNDHKNGFKKYFKVISELSHIGKIPGMVTDSRSFLSYARHDYFRSELSSYLAKFENEELDGLIKTAKDIAYFNIKGILDNKKRG
ncbi:MAG: glucuronate isomerase [Christensenellaceae bacterium]|jgi:glucuronate isomerase|nr:glucuronate isomerase [Christensenellaceae bacterium]